MAYVNFTPVGATVQAPPIVKELQSLFDSLDDTPLLKALIDPSRRGPKGHPVYTLWRCFLVKHYLSLPSTAAMIRTLINNPFVAQACGIQSPDAIPHEATFSRFFSRLSKRDMLAKVKDVSRRLVRHHYATVPGFGERVALDSTTLKAWSNGGKPRKADPEAGWSIKKGTQGTKEFTYGWKLHLLVDCESELPIAANVSTGNVHDAKKATNVLREARFTQRTFRPRFFMADKGYSGRPLYGHVRKQYGAEPIIQVNPGHRKLMAQIGMWEKTETWKTLYKQRQSVERAFSRLKGQRSLNNITVRRRMKVTLHCYLALIVMQALAIPYQPLPRF